MTQIQPSIGPRRPLPRVRVEGSQGHGMIDWTQMSDEDRLRVNTLVSANMRMVEYSVNMTLRHFVGQGIDESKLEEAGMYTLARCAWKYDSSIGKFSTLAMDSVKKAVRREALYQVGKRKSFRYIPTKVMHPNMTRPGVKDILGQVADNETAAAEDFALGQALEEMHRIDPRLLTVLQYRIGGLTQEAIGKMLVPPIVRERVRQLEEKAKSYLAAKIRRHFHERGNSIAADRERLDEGYPRRVSA